MLTMSFTARDERDAALAAVLAQGVREGKVHPVDALRAIKHEMRRRNTDKHALHADHVHELGPADMQNTITVDDWIRVLAQARIVVVVTAKENYELEQLENAGPRGPAKYLRAGLRWAAERPLFVPTG